MRRAILVTVAALALGACTAITDFSMPGGRFSLDENLTANPVTVTLDADGTGTLALVFAEALPGADDAALLALIDDGTILVDVVNDETDNSLPLTDGERVDGAPEAAGEYALALDEARTTLAITFYNETAAGSSVSAGGDYSVGISVGTNSYFTVEDFVREVTVND